MTKVGRNDPCPCGSGKKYKQCCINKVLGPRKIQAKWINQKQPEVVNLMDRAFGQSIEKASESDLPPLPTTPPPPRENEKS